MADDTSRKLPAHLRADLQFQKGRSGNPAGRPKGSRSKLGEDFLAALHADFAAHGPAVIARVRDEKPDQYLKVVASILPRDVNIDANEFDGVSDEELLAQLRRLDAQLRPFLDDVLEADDVDGDDTDAMRH